MEHRLSRHECEAMVGSIMEDISSRPDDPEGRLAAIVRIANHYIDSHLDVTDMTSADMARVVEWIKKFDRGEAAIGSIKDVPLHGWKPRRGLTKRAKGFIERHCSRPAG
jgi:hypothetical protein